MRDVTVHPLSGDQQCLLPDNALAVVQPKRELNGAQRVAQIQSKMCRERKKSDPVSGGGGDVRDGNPRSRDRDRFS